MRTIAIAVMAVALGSAGAVRAQTANDCFQATLKEDYENIIQICSRVIEKGGLNRKDRSITVSNRGLGYLQLQRYDEAIRDCDEAIRIDPNNAFAFDQRGEAWRAKGDIKRALADFKQALRIDPNFSAALLNLGITYEEDGDVNGARSNYEQVLRMKGERAIDQWARRQAKARLDKLPPRLQ